MIGRCPYYRDIDRGGLADVSKAVTKARLTQAIINTRALFNALEIYRLENGSYPTTTDLNAQNELTSLLVIDVPPIEGMRFYYYQHAYVGYRDNKTL